MSFELSRNDVHELSSDRVKTGMNLKFEFRFSIPRNVLFFVSVLLCWPGLIIAIFVHHDELASRWPFLIEENIALQPLPDPGYLCGIRVNIFAHTAGRVVYILAKDQTKGHAAIGPDPCHTLCRLSHRAGRDMGTAAIRRREGHNEVLGRVGHRQIHDERHRVAFESIWQ